ncbi:MAG: hypothetical protein PHI53_02565 [Candidatus Pacebacteria bacterium]|nr:hypothetical protein [Candidatus Paceibacterota bacterium]
MKKSLLIIFLIFTGLLFFTSSVSAAGTNCPTGLVPCGTSGCPCTLCDFFVMFNRIFVFFLYPPPIGGGIVLGIAILMITYSGFLFMTAYTGLAGDPQGAFSRAKQVIIYTIIGLLIVYGAWIILHTFFYLIGFNRYGSWYQVNCQ